MSKERLDEFAHLSYDSSYRNRDYNGYRNTYLAVKTLHQHKRYFDYFEKKYKSNDYPEISSIHISEIRTVPVNAENLNEYIEVLELCGKLFDSNREEHKERALRLYHKWFQEYSPISFVPLCTDTISEENAWELKSTEIGIFLQRWGSLAAKLNIPTPDIKKDLGICERYSCIGENEIVLAASLWYPWGHKDGTIYTESTKIDLPIKTNVPVQFDLCLGNYGLLAREEAVDECCCTAIGTGGRSLFNRVCGCLSLFFGNCQLAPSSIWGELFRCKPKSGDPYTWVDDKGCEVLRFERIASPIREAVREAYIRQPILFRWICNKTWLTAFLQNENLCLYPICTQEPYPALMD